jgi:hypothetical protein
VAAPSAVLTAIVSGLQTLLGARVSVSKNDGELGDDGKEFLAFKSPGVIVACIGVPRVDDHQKWGDARFVAFCHARAANVTAQQTTVGDVAMDLGAVVTGHLAGNNTWGGAARSTPHDIRLSNMFDNKLAQKGLRIWAVSWMQKVDLPSQVDESLLERLAAITHTFAMGDDATPDVSLEVEFPEDP